jgi:hypothetical protein
VTSPPSVHCVHFVLASVQPGHVLLLGLRTVLCHRMRLHSYIRNNWAKSPPHSHPNTCQYSVLIDICHRLHAAFRPHPTFFQKSQRTELSSFPLALPYFNNTQANENLSRLHISSPIHSGRQRVKLHHSTRHKTRHKASGPPISNYFS